MPGGRRRRAIDIAFRGSARKYISLRYVKRALDVRVYVKRALDVRVSVCDDAGLFVKRQRQFAFPAVVSTTKGDAVLAETRAAAIAVIAAIVHCAIQPAAAQSGTGIIVAPTVTDGSAWRGTFVLSRPASNVRVRYATGHCAAARQYARTILAITESGGKYNNVWMAVERSKGPVEAASFTPRFALPAGTYNISVEGKTDGGKPLKLAVCVGIDDA